MTPPDYSAAARNIAVTGATGFIGQTLCTRLLEQGYSVCALVRDPQRASKLQALGVTLITGDLHDASALQQLVHDADAVIHCAGAVRGNQQSDFSFTNVDGTRSLITAMEGQSGQMRLLMLSSIVAREPQLSWYAASKRAGEELVTASALDWTILRPPAVYGPGDKEMKPLFDALSRGIAVVPGASSARTSLIHAEDVVSALLHALRSAATIGHIYTLGDGTPKGYDWVQIAAIASALKQRPVRLFQVPHWLLDSIATVNLASARLSGRAAMLTPPKLRELRHPDWTADETPFIRDSGWQPRISLQQGLQEHWGSAL